MPFHYSPRVEIFKNGIYKIDNIVFECGIGQWDKLLRDLWEKHPLQERELLPVKWKLFNFDDNGC